MIARILIVCLLSALVAASPAATATRGHARPHASAGKGKGKGKGLGKVKKKKKKPVDPNLAHASDAYSALQKYLYVPAYGLYKGSPYSHVWPFSQALAGTVSLASLPKGAGRRYAPDVAARISSLGYYLVGAANPPGYGGGVQPPLGRGGTIGYDDNEWIGIELMRQYRRAPNPDLLARARSLFDLAVSGWDRDASHPCPGGVVFNQSPTNTDRNTVTNAPGVELGLRLYLVTRDPYFLDWSKRFYDWVRGCLVSPEGLFQDHIDFGGNRNQTIWTYNQGTMVGAAVLFYQATGDPSYLVHAQRNAHGAVAYFNRDVLTREPPYFVAIFFDNLALLDSVRHDPLYRRTAQWYADWAWKAKRQSTGVFSFGTDSGRVIEQAAMIRIYATLAGATP
ncbi:MAG: glycoside hydrolase family 76 protein [Myxococcales bacterium]